jgi:hypothetical protein
MSGAKPGQIGICRSPAGGCQRPIVVNSVRSCPVAAVELVWFGARADAISARGSCALRSQPVSDNPSAQARINDVERSIDFSPQKLERAT